MENEIDILIIEDDALIAESIKMQLDDFGYGITRVCYKYDTAIAAIEEANYDLIISDINLGYGIDEKSGITLMEHLKKVKKCPFIFLTAFSDKDTLKKATSLYPSAYLVKPVNAANLYAAVQLAMENYQNTKTANIDTLKKEETPDYFFTKLGNALIKIYWKDVYHLEATKNYVRIKTAEYNSGVLIRSSLQQVLTSTIPEVHRKLFIKINRSVAIAKRIVLTVNDTSVETIYGFFETTGDMKRQEL